MRLAIVTATLLGTAFAYPPLASTYDLQARQGQACSTSSGDGTCQSVSSCNDISIAGKCPGSNDIQCCVKRTCTTSSGAGNCKNTNKGCTGGTFVSGACPGDNTVQCCVTGSGGGGGGGGGGACPNDPNVATVDFSDDRPDSWYTCAAKCYKKIVVRGYRQVNPSSGVCNGGVDSNLQTAFQKAAKAGINNFGAYLFPCTGTQNSGACKTPQQQFGEFEDAVASAGIKPDRLWFDIEPQAGRGCPAWNLGTDGNIALAKQWVALIKGSTRFKWGIYTNANQWAEIFGAKTVDIGASDLPLWAVQFDKQPGVATANRFPGNWNRAYAKQYWTDTNLTDIGCGSPAADKNSFTA